MQIKEGASLQGLDIRMRSALITADRIWQQHGQELVVTAGLDGTHSAGSLHYYGRAIDLRTRYFDKAAAVAVAGELRDALGSDFDVVLHSSHVHVEYDPA
tara:strand:- start:26827 stop:27126 length:300 start_codon:yes stop_codon:yes gene_type:complete